jgi:Holliday junction resolvase
MSRPIYETPVDRFNEVLLADKMHLAWGYEFLFHEELSPYDCTVLKKGRPKALMEIKTRSCQKHAYDTFFISHAKVSELWVFAQSRGLSAAIAVQWSDGWGVHVLDNNKEYSKTIGGRLDRDDPSDIESMIHIPIEDFVCG